MTCTLSYGALDGSKRFYENNMTASVTHLKLTQKEIDLLNITVRSYINMISDVNHQDNTQEALTKHEQIFELIALLKKLNLVKPRLSSNFEPSCGLIGLTKQITAN